MRYRAKNITKFSYTLPATGAENLNFTCDIEKLKCIGSLEIHCLIKLELIFFFPALLDDYKSAVLWNRDNSVRLFSHSWLRSDGAAGNKQTVMLLYPLVAVTSCRPRCRVVSLPSVENEKLIYLYPSTIKQLGLMSCAPLIYKRLLLFLVLCPFNNLHLNIFKCQKKNHTPKMVSHVEHHLSHKSSPCVV